jgi:hypothetical protein
MKDSIIDKILCSTGYLPPRNEEEMTAFEKIYSKVTVKTDFRVDVDQIVNGGCRVKSIVHRFESVNASSSDMLLAARNFEALPKDVIEKIKKQHKSKDDEGE